MSRSKTHEESKRKIETMVKMRLKGKTFREIADACDVTVSWACAAVNSVLCKTEGDKAGPKSVYNEKQWNWVRDRIDEGHTIAEAAEFLGLNGSTVRGHIHKKQLIPLEERKAEFYKLADEYYD